MIKKRADTDWDSNGFKEDKMLHRNIEGDLEYLESYYEDGDFYENGIDFTEDFADCEDYIEEEKSVKKRKKQILVAS